MREPWAVVQSDGVIVETHATERAAAHAVEVLNAHEQRCAADRAAGNPHALRADRPGRPFTYQVQRRGVQP